MLEKECGDATVMDQIRSQRSQFDIYPGINAENRLFNTMAYQRYIKRPDHLPPTSYSKSTSVFKGLQQQCRGIRIMTQSLAATI